MCNIVLNEHVIFRDIFVDTYAQAPYAQMYIMTMNGKKGHEFEKDKGVVCRRFRKVKIGKGINDVIKI